MFFSVHDAKATTFTLDDQSSCQTLGGNWDSPYFTCIIGNLVLNPGDSLTINSGTALSIIGNLTNSGTIANLGNINNNPGGTITNSGTIINSGFITNMGSITISNSGLFTNNAASMITNSYLLNNFGNIINNIGGTITSSETINNFGTLSNSGTVTNYAASPISNSGTITNSGTMINYGDINNTGTTTDTCTGTINLTYNGTLFGNSIQIQCISSQPPTGLTSVGVSPSQINLSWSPPSNNGGSAINGYKIERSTNGGSTWSTLVANTSSTATTYSDTGLASNTGYTYRVSAINSGGTSSPSNTTSATTLSPNTILILNAIPNVPWGQTITLSGKLTDSNGTGLVNEVISFDGTGAVNLPSVTTNGTGFFSSSVAAPSTVSTGWTAQAHFAGDSTYAKSDSQIDHFNTVIHNVSLVLNTKNVPWSTATAFTATLKDLTTGTSISGYTIHFNGTGVIGVSDQTTDSNGMAVGTGTAPSTVSTGWTVQVHFVGDSLYVAKDSKINTYNTLVHNTALTLALPGLVQHGALYSVTGVLTDSTTGTPLFTTITFTATSPITIPQTSTDSTGRYTVSNLVAPAPGSYNIQAHYVGNPKYGASSSPTKPLSVN